MKLRIQPPFQIVAGIYQMGLNSVPGSPTGLPERAFDTGCICLSTKRPGKSERAARRRSDPAPDGPLRLVPRDREQLRQPLVSQPFANCPRMAQVVLPGLRSRSQKF